MKINFPFYQTIVVFLMLCIFTACGDPPPSIVTSDELNEEMQTANKTLFTQTLQKHLDAVSQRDLETLKSTLSPKGDMYLILPKSRITSTVDEFIDYHEEWFQDTSAWTFDTKILHTDVGRDMGMGIVEIVYREPERDGKSYFNRMAVTYDLRKEGGNWYVVKDQACSLEKSTDE